jgi:ABC-type branched-subunit amino acid transport system ATPase component/MFS family permease
LSPLRRYLNGEAVLPVTALFLLNAADELDSRTFELLGPEIADHFHVGVGTFGGITLLVLLLAPLVALPVAYLADRRARVPLAVVGAVVWGAFSLLTGLAPVLWVLVVARVGSGFGKVVNTPVHASLIADSYTPETRAKVFGLHALANTVGVMVASVLAGVLADLFDFRLPFFVLTLPTLVAVLVAMRYREPARGATEVPTERATTPPAAGVPFVLACSRLWSIRSLRSIWIGLAWCAGSVLGIGVLVPFFLRDDFGVKPTLRGFILGGGTAVSAIAVLVGTALVQKRLVQSAGSGLRLVCAAGFVAAGALFALAVAPNLVAAVALIWLITAVFAFVTPGLNAIGSLVAPPELRSQAFALGGVVALAGSGFALAGFAIGDSAGMRWAVATMAPIFLRGMFHFRTACRYIDDDVARLTAPDLARLQLSAAESAQGLEGADLIQHTPLLVTQGLGVSYDGVRVLFGVDLWVGEGEVVALLGTNGAGKSTTLNAISGVVVPDRGNIWFDGEPIVGEPPERTVRRGIIQVPGGRGIFPGLTVGENLAVGGFTLRRDRALLAERRATVLELFPRLVERMHQPAGNLSGGERQMLTLAQSFLLQPRLMLLDELSLGLAPAVVAELLEAVRGLNRAGATVVVVEQSVNIALTLADRAYFLEKGEVRFSGHTADLLARPDILRSVFLEGAATRNRSVT